MAQIKVDQIAGQSGSTVTVPTGQTLTITDGLAVASGGTGLTSVSGQAGKFIKVNSGASALEFGTVTTDLVGDTSPQLGGSLDVNGQNVVSVSNGNINLIPNGTGRVSVQGSMDSSVSSTGKAIVFGF
tara:strand:+ start:545 stop:928 length:384 start_codon:yes stop_codon:yes gene_type:complete